MQVVRSIWAGDWDRRRSFRIRCIHIILRYNKLLYSLKAGCIKGSKRKAIKFSEVFQVGFSPQVPQGISLRIKTDCGGSQMIMILFYSLVPSAEVAKESFPSSNYQ